jgi:hypothetical protein
VAPLVVLVADEEHGRPAVPGHRRAKRHLDESPAEYPPVLGRAHHPPEGLIDRRSLHQGSLPAADKAAQYILVAIKGFHGCPLVIAAVQAPDSAQARELAGAHKAWLQGRLTQFARRAGLKTPEVLASSLVLVLEGAAALSAVQPVDRVARHTRAACRALIAAHRP